LDWFLVNGIKVGHFSHVPFFGETECFQKVSIQDEDVNGFEAKLSFT